MQLVNYGREVIKFRRDFIKQLNEIIHAIHLSLTGGREDITISYEPYTPQDQMEDVLKRNRAQDMKQKTTLSGPHRDDISFIVNGIDIRRIGSLWLNCLTSSSSDSLRDRAAVRCCPWDPNLRISIPFTIKLMSSL